MYDFDKTLCTKDMQEYRFIPDLGIAASDFWSEASTLASGEKMDRILAYMYLMIDKAHAAKKTVKRDDFKRLGAGIEFYDGVADWFGRVNIFGKENGASVEHYIISSGLKEIIEGSAIYKEFKEIYACEFHYDEHGVAAWPKNVVNYTTKTQFLFRINKNVLDLSEDDALNKYIPQQERRVPFRNMIYVGDGLTDVPCMRLVKESGGQSIAVYPAKKRDKKAEAEKLLLDHRVNFIAKADFSQNSELEKIAMDIIQKICAEDKLVSLHTRQLKEAEKARE
jgi:2-hydroxy-3-keto-5-methylthiopentenyl-1-phosphate phosphatase